ncbi:hypothetical protein IWQ62_004124 [Dispira parvispora]|uniref:C2H2-type domain-containing protein n=1 Tax=Dispira parvispora TaxID=1520584 RepID=A0A9W8E5W8_9FUNG|nr:hypothetical protein IWQ62_004124 [Dispira parvispora]
MSRPLYCPTRRRRSPDDPFFSEGNHEAQVDWLTKQAYVPGPADSAQLESSMDEELDRELLYCDEPECINTSPFTSSTAYEAHYNFHHRYQCTVCHIRFPNDQWLILHQAELHDPFIKLRAARGEPVYGCFLATCSTQCRSAVERKQHMIQNHGYSPHFRFDMVIWGLDTFNHPPPQDPSEYWQTAHTPTSTPEAMAVDLDSVTDSFGKLRVLAPSDIRFGHSCD